MNSAPCWCSLPGFALCGAEFTATSLSTLQVLSWVSAALALGEAFSGDDSRQLREALASSAREAFAMFHTAQLQRLQGGLSRESWRRADVDTSGVSWRRAAWVPVRLHAWCHCSCYQMIFEPQCGSKQTQRMLQGFRI